MKRSVIAIALALVYLASAAKPVSADPIQHFSTFSITCAGTVFEIVSKPGSSNVVTVNQSDRTAICTENGDPPGVIVVAEVKFTPGP